MRKLIFVLPFILFACTPCKYVSKHPECFKVDTTITDTVTVVTESVEYILDSAALDLYLECDSNYNVLIQEWSSTEAPKGEIKLVYKYKTNHLQVKAFTDSIKILNTIIERYNSTITTVLNPINNQLEEDLKKCNNKMKSRNWLWWYFAVSILIALIIIYFKLVK